MCLFLVSIVKLEQVDHESLTGYWHSGSSSLSWILLLPVSYRDHYPSPHMLLASCGRLDCMSPARLEFDFLLLTPLCFIRSLEPLSGPAWYSSWLFVLRRLLHVLGKFVMSELEQERP
jgi:hypothetical protein